MSHTLIQWDREDKIGRIKVRKLVGVDKAGLIVKPKAAHTSKVKQGIQSLFLSHGQVAVQPSPGKQGSLVCNSGLVLWFNPSQKLITRQLLCHSPTIGQARESEE